MKRSTELLVSKQSAQVLPDSRIQRKTISVGCDSNDTMTQDQEFLEFLIKALVDNPSAVKTDRKVDEMGVLLTLRVDPADMGKIIGRNGNTAKAIRSLLRVVGIKNNARVNLKIEEPEGGRGPRTVGGAGMGEDHSASPNRDRDLDDVVGDLKL